MNYSDEAWVRFGEVLASERGGRGRDAVAAATGVGARTIQEYEDGKPFQRPPGKLWDLLRYYRWTPDSWRDVLAGGLPTYLPELPPTPLLTPAEHDEIVKAIESHPMLPGRRRRKLLKTMKDLTERPPSPEAI